MQFRPFKYTRSQCIKFEYCKINNEQVCKLSPLCEGTRQKIPLLLTVAGISTHIIYNTYIIVGCYRYTKDQQC